MRGGGGARDRIRGRNTAKQFLYNRVFSFPRRGEDGLREEAGEFTCALTHACTAREKRMNSHEWSSDSRFAIRDPLSHSALLPASRLVTNYAVPRIAYRLLPMKPDENALSISPPLMIINAKRDEISLMGHNISAALSWYCYLISRTKDTSRRAPARSSPRDFYRGGLLLPAINEGD